MDISFEKLDLIQKILLISDEKLINALSSFIEKKRNVSDEVGGYDSLPEAVKESIDLSQLQLRDGKGIPLADVVNKYRNRYQR